MAQIVFAPIDTDERAGYEIQLPVEASINLYPGTMVAVDSSGNATFASDVAGLIAMGRCQGPAMNAAGAAGAVTVNVRRGVFAWVNSSTHPLAEANVGQPCFVQDEQTVATQSTNFVRAGIFLGIDPNTNKAWVDMRPAPGFTPSADTITPLAFASPPTQANLDAFQAALVALFKGQGLII
jgi:hypothetical protein